VIKGGGVFELCKLLPTVHSS